MTLTLSGSGTIGGLVAGGLPDATVTAADLASGAARTNFGAGAVLQVVSATKTDTFSTTSTSFSDVTGLSVSITPSSTTSKIFVIYNVQAGFQSGTNAVLIQLVRNTTPICIADAASNRPRLSSGAYVGDCATTTQVSLITSSNNYLDSPSTTAATTYKIIAATAVSGQSAYINRTSADRDASTYDQRAASSITVMEIAG